MYQRVLTRRFLNRPGLTLALLLVALLAMPTLVAHAGGITVDSTADNTFTDGDCTLREAITNANNDATTYIDCNAGSDHDTLTITANGTITLGSALPQLSDDATIVGPGMSSLSISGDNAHRVFYINSGTAVTITGVTIRDGYLSSIFGNNGGGIYSAGDLRLSHTNVLSSSAYSGGGVYVAQGTATLVETHVLSNSAKNGGGVYVFQGMATLTGTHVLSNSAQYGGGVCVFQGAAMLTGTHVLSNSAQYGAGVYVDRGTATLTGTHVLGNSAADFGGGVYVHRETATLTAGGGEINHNSADNSGGGVYVDRGMATLTETHVLDNSTANFGGGVFVDQGAATLIGTHVLSNSAQYGGGVYVDRGTAMLTGTYVLGNFTSQDGGGVYVLREMARLVASGGEINRNSAANNGGGVFVDLGAATLTGAHVLGNSASQDGGGLYLDSSGAITATHGCVVGNSDTSVDNAAGGSGTLVATDNWWGVANGPSGAGPGSGDSVSADVDYGNFKTAPPAGCPTLPPALTLSKGVDYSVPRPGQRIIYTIAVTHTKGTTATSALISDALPDGLTFAGPVTLDPPGAGTTGTPPTLVSDLTIAVGERVTVSFPVIVNTGLAAGTVITNTAAITSAEAMVPQTGAVGLTVAYSIYLPHVLK